MTAHEQRESPADTTTRPTERKKQSLQEKFRNVFTTTRANEESDKAKMLTDEKIESQQNTDPQSDPTDSAAAGVIGEAGAAEPGSEQVNQQGDLGSVPAIEYLRLKTELDHAQDRAARLQADFDNYRKREARERAEFREYAVAGAVEQFLPVLDNFQLALKSTGSADQLRTGVELIVKQMEEALRNLNVQTVETVGATFDPRVHEALDTVEQHSLPDQQVFEEVRRGYKIRERLLRPALVRVVSNPQQKEA
ncbi:MAG TPA: nucleotide exchange factor GrpE [Acidisarcina sp.]